MSSVKRLLPSFIAGEKLEVIHGVEEIDNRAVNMTFVTVYKTHGTDRKKRCVRKVISKRRSAVLL